MPTALAPLCLSPIGVVHSPFENIEEMPIQPAGAANIRGSIELCPDLVPGLQDLEGFSHLWVIYHFHRAERPGSPSPRFSTTTPTASSPPAPLSAPIPLACRWSNCWESRATDC